MPIVFNVTCTFIYAFIHHMDRYCKQAYITAHNELRNQSLSKHCPKMVIDISSKQCNSTQVLQDRIVCWKLCADVFSEKLWPVLSVCMFIVEKGTRDYGRTESSWSSQASV